MFALVDEPTLQARAQACPQTLRHGWPARCKGALPTFFAKRTRIYPIDRPSTDWIQNFNKESKFPSPLHNSMGLLRSLGFSRRAKIHPAAVIFLACCFLFVVFSSEEESYEDSAAEQAAYSAAVHDAAS